MKIEPNGYIGQQAEYVLCEVGQVVLHDGARVPMADLGIGENAFTQLCRSIDPNKCFIVAIIPNDSDRDVFFKAREAASGAGVHMQATVDTPERLRGTWENYKESKRHRSVEEETEESLVSSLTTP